MNQFIIDQADVIGALPEAVLVTTHSGEISYINQALTDLTGFDEANLVGQPVAVLLPSGERARLDVLSWFNRWADNPDAEQLKHLSLNGVTAAGDALRYRVRVSKFSQNDETFFLIVLRDVTEEYQESIKLRHERLVSNRILAIGEDAVLTIDENQNIVYWNPKAEQVFGYSVSEIVGKSIQILLPDYAKGGHKKQVQGFSKSSAASKLMGSRAEIQGKTKAGSIVPLEASITKTSVDGQQLISAQIRDISQRKAQEKTLASSELKFRTLFHAALEAIALLDTTGQVLEINQAAMSLLPNGATVDKKLFWQLPWWQSDDQEIQGVLKQHVIDAAKGEATRIKANVQSPNGQRTVDFSLTPVRDELGELAYILAEGRDITGLEED